MIGDGREAVEVDKTLREEEWKRVHEVSWLWGNLIGLACLQIIGDYTNLRGLCAGVLMDPG